MVTNSGLTEISIRTGGHRNALYAQMRLKRRVHPLHLHLSPLQYPKINVLKRQVFSLQFLLKFLGITQSLQDSSIISISEQPPMAIQDSHKPCFSRALELGSRMPKIAGQENTYILEKRVKLRHMPKCLLNTEIIHTQNTYLHVLPVSDSRPTEKLH